MHRLLVALPLFVSLNRLLAQEITTEDATSPASAIAELSCTCIVLLAVLAIQIAIAVWVFRDARSRGMNNAIVLAIVMAFIGLLAFLPYLLMRPKGILVRCPSCGKKRLEGSAKCPRCGTA